MGVGLPDDLVEGVARGIDLFDCVVPSRHGRTGWLFTSFGRVLIRNARYATDERPVDPSCACPVCTRYSRAYLHHLFLVKEMLGVRLNTIHNLHFYAGLMERIRQAITSGTFAEFRARHYEQRERSRAEADSPDEQESRLLASSLADEGRP
jgi:queuine tRNA-ribosyltransferase